MEDLLREYGQTLDGLIQRREELERQARRARGETYFLLEKRIQFLKAEEDQMQMDIRRIWESLHGANKLKLRRSSLGKAKTMMDGG